MILVKTWTRSRKLLGGKRMMGKCAETKKSPFRSSHYPEYKKHHVVSITILIQVTFIRVKLM